MTQDPESQKNLLLAIVLSVLVLIGWQVLYANPKMKEEQERRERLKQGQQTQQQTNTQGTTTAPSASPGTTATPLPPGVASKPGTEAPSAAAASAFLSRETALQASPRAGIETPSLKGSIALKGARIDDIVLQKYREQVDPKSPNVVLFAPSGTKDTLYAEFGWLSGAGATIKLPDAQTEWRVEKGPTLTPATPLTLGWDNGQGHIFRRTFSVDDNFMFVIEDSVQNTSGTALTLDHRALISRHGTPTTQGFYILHEGMIGVVGEKGILQEITYSDILKGVKDGETGQKALEKITGGWLGFTDKYWAAALIPDQKAELDGFVSGFNKSPTRRETYQIDYIQRGVALPAGGTATVTQNLFAGAKQVQLIETYRDKLGVKQLDMLVDWGWFYFITKPLFKLMSWLTGVLGNYGLAILATTVLVKLVFFPLANKSYESMAKMKKLQPEMEKLREQHKDDRAAQQQELMKLYQKEKINPAAGCLPILLQIPVFFALYKVLFVTIDMRHAPFFGWIKDLSAPDPTSIFNLFGLLPFALPEFLLVGAWPLIMGATMWVQMQLNPQQPDPMQQKIFNWMPVMFTFMLASFPAGLVIYWAWNNVLSLIQQYWIMKKNGTEIHLWKNMGIEKWLSRKQT
jgi:YidC/Oxa1 family membrane protein insertase